MSTDYGTDVWCDDQDCADDGALVSDPRLLLTQQLLRAWTTRRGSLLSDANYGTDLTEYVNADVDNITINACKSDAKSEAEKNEHISSCVVNRGYWEAPDGGGLLGRIVLVLTVNSYDGSTFPLTIAISDVTVEVLANG